MTLKQLVLSATLALTVPFIQAGTLVEMDTSEGVITLELNDEKAPISTQNFLSYVDSNFYDGLIFHRVIPNFMIQGGGMNKEMQPRDTRTPIKNESNNGLSNLRGSIAMARTQAPDSATAQFYINTVDNLSLDGRDSKAGYAVFGKVISGMDIVDMISSSETSSKGYFRDVPVKPIIINHVSRVN